MTLTCGSAHVDLAGALAGLGSLPDWLAAGMEAGRVGASLLRHVPDLADGRCRLLACAPERLRVADDGWRARYRVTVAGPDGRARESILVGTMWPPTAGPAPDPGPAAAPERATPPGAPCLGEPGWRGWLPDLRLALRAQTHDEPLPALTALLDPGAVIRLLRPVLHEAGYRDAALAGCRLRVARYKPGSRCTVLADLDYARPGRPEPPNPVVLKTHDDERGGMAWAAMTALWRRPEPWQDAVRLAEPLAYLPAERVLVQGPVPGERTLKDLIRRAAADGGPDLAGRLREPLAATARGLAALHASNASYPRTVTFAGELAETGDLAARLSASVPQVAAAVGPMLRHLDRLAHTRPPDPLVPAHHDFRPAQVLLHGHGVGFIDFDKACMAEPALDLAAFRTQLRDVGIAAMSAGGPGRPDAGLVLLDDVCEHFLAAYRRHAPVSPARVRLWETLHLLTALLHAWAKVRPARLQPRLALLQHHLGADPTLGDPAPPRLAPSPSM
jgi:hypothetical protein